MDFSKTFTKASEIRDGVVYTCRRLTLGERAKLEMEVMRESAPFLRERERLQGEGASEAELKRHKYLTCLAAEVPATLRAGLAGVEGLMLDGKPATVSSFLSSADSPLDLVEEAFAIALTGIRMTAEELGNWLSPGTLPPAGTASANNTTVPAASPNVGIATGSVGDTSPAA